ncbi:MAG: alkaline phosphatase family protein, partial [Candidatus Binatia bacterium]
MLLILGLDGATLDLVEPWVADGTLPNLGRVLAEGAWGPLASTVPAATFPSWTSFMTGVNPGRHGIFDFTRRDGGAYAVRFVNSTFRKAPTIWRLLSDAGRRVSVLGLPGTYPPEAINGYMISGFDTPVTTRADASFVHPPEFADEVAEAGGFPFADFQEFSLGPGWHAQALQSLCDGIERKTALAERVLARAPWDCFMLLFGESDTAAHHFWGLHDPASPRHDAAGAAVLGNPLRTVYAALDEAIGRLRRRVPDATVLVVSDHGFGGSGTTGLHLNRWLAQEGLLSFAPRARRARWA